jgi:hypothetical protein
VVTEAQVEGSTIPEDVAIEGVVPKAGVSERTAPSPEALVAPEITKEIPVDVLPESSMDIVVRSPEIQDAEPIRSAPMSETATTSRDGLELLTDDLVDPATLASNLESMRRAEQWMKVRSSTSSSRVTCGVFDIDYCLCAGCHRDIPTQI